jgi:hypothetical protein
MRPSRSGLARAFFGFGALLLPARRSAAAYLR